MTPTPDRGFMASWKCRDELPEPLKAPAADGITRPPPRPGWDAYEHPPQGAPWFTRQPAQRVGLVNPPVAVARCLCGGEIVVTRPDSEDDVVVAIRSHQDTTRHTTWRESR